jgi:hypothetical protein
VRAHSAGNGSMRRLVCKELAAIAIASVKLSAGPITAKPNSMSSSLIDEAMMQSSSTLRLAGRARFPWHKFLWTETSPSRS